MTENCMIVTILDERCFSVNIGGIQAEPFSLDD